MVPSKVTVPRVVFDTSVVVSALVFRDGMLSWMRHHWHSGICTPLLSQSCAQELQDVLAYPKFKLTESDRQELLAEYVPLCTIVHKISACPVKCRDSRDQIFLDLAHGGRAHSLVSSDRDLLALAGETGFLIETPAQYRQREVGAP
jgi:uncharacterized protein